MHKYINFAKSYFEEKGCDILERENNLNNGFIFKYKQILFLFSLDQNFPYSLPLIITTKDFPDFPHFIEGTNITSICLGYEDDFNLYESSPETIITETINKFFRLLNLSIYQQNKEFFKEFLHFWHKKADFTNKIKLYIKPKQNAEEIFINETLEKDESKKIAKKKFRTVYTKNTFINSFNFKSGTTLKGIYIPLINLSYLSPFPNKWDIKELLNLNISNESYKFIKNYIIDKKEIWIVFSVKLENDFEIMFTAKFKFKSNDKKSLLEKLKNNINEIIPYYSKRYDVDYLCQRTSGNFNGINKKVAIIGCGSLGSYIATELCKLGIAQLNLFDSDILMPENLFRHVLGANFVGFNKALGLKFKLESDYPQIKINTDENKINFNNIFDKNLEEFDLIICAIGNSTTQLLINKYLAKIKFTKPVLYTWLDSFGTGCHALFVDYSKLGCYNCLSLDEHGHFLDKSKITFSKNSDDIIFGDGCGGSFTPYGNVILLKGTSMIIKIILDYFSGESYSRNPLFSIKNYPQKNIEYTDQFFKPEAELLETYDFIVERCDVCGK